MCSRSTLPKKTLDGLAALSAMRSIPDRMVMAKLLAGVLAATTMNPWLA